MKILVLGGVSYDTMIYVERFPEPRPQTIFSRGGHETVGSTGAGKALNLSRLGFDVTLHATIGDDECGHKIRAEFERSRINFLADIDPQGTERHLNLMEEGGGRISIYFAYASPDPPLNLQAIEAVLNEQTYVVLNINNYCRRLIPIIQNAGKQIWCDIHDWDGANEYHREFVNAADYLFLSSDAMPNYREFMRGMVDSGKKLVVSTHGKHGSTALTPEGEWIETPILETFPRKDTNGAGDAFFSGFVYGYASGRNLTTSLRYATITAGLCISSTELAHPDLSPERLMSEYGKHYGT